MSILTVNYLAKDAPELFCQSLQETGFAVIDHHPIDTNIIFDAYQGWENFFNSALEEKMKYLYQKSTQEGYFPFRTENAKDSKISDLKEFYHVYKTGLIPPPLKEISLTIFNELLKLSAQLLEWIELYLPSSISKKLSMPLKEMIIDSTNTLLRILHYPPLTQHDDDEALRAAPHEDINLITLLPAATAPGLEVLDTQGNWHAVSCDPGSIVVNVGDMLQMCTENYYKSTTHRVVNPKDANKNISRYSMPLFLHPRKEVKLSKDLTAMEYLKERLRAIGIY